MSHTFTDTAGRAWDLSLTIGSIKRVKNALDVDLLRAIDDPATVRRLSDDVACFVDVLFVICQPAATAAGVSDVEFGEALDGDVLDAASAAFLEALVDFFPKAKRAILKKIVQRAELHQQRAADLIAEAIDGGALDDRLDAELAKMQAELTRVPATAGRKSGKSRARRASTPAA